MTQRLELTRHFPALASSDYRALWLASGASAVSIWSLIMARAWLALELADSGFSVAIVTFAAIAPWTLAPIAGVLADRYDRARIVMIARVVQMLLALGLAALAFTEALQVWHLVLFAFANGLGWSFERAGENSLLPNTIDSRSLLNAITLVSLASFGSRLVGPLVGAPLLAGAGAGWIFVMSAGFYLLAAGLTTRIRVRSTGGVSAEGPIFAEARKGLAEAFRYLGANPQLKVIIAVVALHCFLTMSFDALLPILARDVFDGGASLFSAMLMGIGGGALAGTLALSFVRRDALRGRLFFATGIVSGVGVVWVGLAPSAAMAVVGAVIIGASQATFVALGSVLIQSVLPDGMRGRVMSLYALFAGGVMAIMVFSNGSAADVVNIRPLLWVPALAFVGLLLLWAALHSDLRRIFGQGTLYLGREPQASGAPAAGR